MENQSTIEIARPKLDCMSSRHTQPSSGGRAYLCGWEKIVPLASRWWTPSDLNLMIIWLRHLRFVVLVSRPNSLKEILWHG